MYTHYFTFFKEKGKAKDLEKTYQLAIKDCQRIVKRWSIDNGGLSGYTAHVPIGKYAGVTVNGSKDSGCEEFVLREHFNQNEWSFVKTERLPYDTVVVACLAVLKHRLGDAITVSSDGNANDWRRGVAFAKKVTGLKLSNPLVARNL
jgi:hypothetical protein